MDALDHKLSSEISEIKKMLMALHKQMQEGNSGAAKKSEAQIQSSAQVHQEMHHFSVTRNFCTFTRFMVTHCYSNSIAELG